MANWISNSSNPESTDVDMSNGATDVVIAALCLAGSDLARTDWERTVVQWIGAHDQTVLGRGSAFFDISQLGWTSEGFAAQHTFVLSVVDHALAHHSWHLLPYSPNADNVDRMLTQIRQLVTEFTLEYVEDSPLVWPTAPPPGFDCCTAHGVLMHAHGCPICNDGTRRTL